MAKLATVTFTGASGTEYRFDVYGASSTFQEGWSAVYAFTKRTESSGTGKHKLLYVGETEDLSERIPGHEKRSCAEEHGVNRIGIFSESDEDERLKIEEDAVCGYVGDYRVVSEGPVRPRESHSPEESGSVPLLLLQQVQAQLPLTTVAR